MTATRRQPEARIAAIAPESIAEELELLSGDVLRAVNGAPVYDYIEYRFAIAAEEVTLEIERDGEACLIDIEKDLDEDLGIGFAEDVFDGMRRCANRCVFCFEEQMPDGMRPSLRLRDDDYRLSFLHGNFVTLTNLREGDLERILREHLSPLYVSVHATDPEVRRRMMGNPRAPEILPLLQALAEGGIELHTQIVLCPGWNNGAVLERTLDELSALYPAVQSIGIVPVGLTAHRPDGPEVRPVTPEDAAQVLNTVNHWQETLLERLDTRLIYPADEFFFATGQAIPSSEYYEGFPQIENGIGLSRLFLDELDDLELPDNLPHDRITLVTGTLAAPLVEQFAVRLRKAGVDAQVIPVNNDYYGGGVSVAGLLTGRDIRAALHGRDPGMLFLPASVLNTDGVFLDDLTPDDLGMPAHFCSSPAEVLNILVSE